MLINILSDNAQSFTYQFSNSTLLQLDSSLFEFTLNDTSKLICEFQNICGSKLDSTTYIPIKPEILARPDTTVCFGDIIQLYSSGAKNYEWFKDSILIGTDSILNVSALNSKLIYNVIGYDSLSCSDSSFVTILTNKLPQVYTMSDYLAYLGENIPLTAISSSQGTYDWYLNNQLICSNCHPAFVQPDKKTEYTVIFTDTNNCKATDNVLVYYDGVLYIPNTFTPDITSQHNNFFKVEGYNITQFEITIFDRWGSVVFNSNNINEGWNGEFNGEPCQIGTYAWKVLYSDVSGNIGEKVGHVNLIR